MQVVGRYWVVTCEREVRSEFLLIYTRNLSMSGRPAVVTLLRGSYCVDEFHDSFHWKAACGADSVNIVIKRH